MRIAVAGVLLAVALAAEGASAKGGRAGDVAAGFGWIWTTTQDGIVRLDPASGRIVGPPLAIGFGDLRVGDGAVWVHRNPLITRVDPGGNETSGTRIRLPRYSYAWDVGGGAVWAATYEDGALLKIDARTGNVLRSGAWIGEKVEDVAVSPTAVWAVSIGPTRRGEGGTIVPLGRGTLTRIESQTSRVVARIPVGRGPGTVAIGAGAVWVVNFRGVGGRRDSLSKIDPQTNRVSATIRLGHLITGVTFGGGYVWAVSPGPEINGGIGIAGGGLVRIDPRTNRATLLEVEGSSLPSDVAYYRDVLWLASPGNASLIRLDPKTMRSRRIAIPASFPPAASPGGDDQPVLLLVGIAAGGLLLATSILLAARRRRGWSPEWR